MRLWSLHPRYLDASGLVAAWREALLAQAVLEGRTRGYRAHPQLIRFRESPQPLGTLARYLLGVAQEGAHRGYGFDLKKIHALPSSLRIQVTHGQLELERRHLLSKLEFRAPERAKALDHTRAPLPHPLFEAVPGPVADWEKARGGMLLNEAVASTAHWEGTAAV